MSVRVFCLLLLWCSLNCGAAFAQPSISDFLPKTGTGSEQGAPVQKRATSKQAGQPKTRPAEPPAIQPTSPVSQNYTTKTKKTTYGEVRYPVFENKLINKAIANIVKGVDDMEFEVQFPGPETVSLIFFQTWEGGAHPNHHMEVRNFNLASGKSIGFADVFTEPAKARKTLGALAARKLLEDPDMKGERPEDGDVFCLSFNSINAIKKGDPEFFKDNIALSPDGVEIVFPVYRTGGEVVKISLAEMGNVKIRPGIWAD